MKVKGCYSVKSLWGGASNPRCPGQGGVGATWLLGQRSLDPAVEREDPRPPEARPRLLPGPVPRIRQGPATCTHLGSSTTRAVPRPPRSTVTAPKAPALPGSNSDSAGANRKLWPSPAPDANCHREAWPGTTPRS